ncbi:MAG: CHAT domain-containing protein [Cyanobacteria bacterium P01_H01_bin.105]
MHNRHYISFLATLLGPILVTPSALAQSITPADTATSVQQTGNQYQIDGGRLSDDSTTLFHSFEQFGLLSKESARFSNPITVENIIGQVISGDASMIDGLLAVDGDANLYLLNPAGIFFGENTQLNLGGSFSASTATGLTFGDELLNVLGSNDYTRLNGAPTGYIFGNEQTSALVNTGSLAVTSGQSLTLLGGQVINTGQLSAAGGEILVMAVPGKNLVRLSQTGSLLDLELTTLPNTVPTTQFTATAMPALLTGASDLGMATDITINPDGTVSLSGSRLQIPVKSGTTIVSGQLEADSGNIVVLGDQIALTDTLIDASGNVEGGTVLIGGDRLGQGSVPNATATVINETSTILANAGDTGNGGKIVAWGSDLLRSTGQLFAQGGTNSGDGGFIETSSLGLLAVGTAPDVSAVNGAGGLWLLDPATIRIVAGNTLTNIDQTPGNPPPANIFSAGAAPPDSELGIDLVIGALNNGDVTISTVGTTPGDGNIILETPLDFDNTGNNTLSFVAESEIQILADIFDSDPESVGPTSATDSLNLSFLANKDITFTGDINSRGGSVDITSQFGRVSANTLATAEAIVFPAPLMTQNNGTITILAETGISTGQLATRGRDIFLTTNRGSIFVDERILTFTREPQNSGGISLLAPEGAVDVSFFINAANGGTNGGGGFISISAQGPVDLGGELISQTISPGNFNAGNVSVNSQTSIAINNIRGTSVNGQGSNVSLSTPGDVVFSSIDVRSETGTGGGVSIIGDVVRGISGDIIHGVSTVVEPGSTIVTDGLGGDGTITINHGGGGIVPFIVGNSSVNGTAGSISTGTTTLENQSFLGSIEIGNIQLSTTDETPTEPTLNPETVILPETILLEIVELATRCIVDCSQVETSERVGQIPIEETNPLPSSETSEKVDQIPTEEASPLQNLNTSERVGQIPVGEIIQLPNPELALQTFENQLTTEFVNYLGLDSDIDGNDTPAEVSTNAEFSGIPDLSTIQKNLRKVQGQTGKRPALIYAVFGASSTSGDGNVLQRDTPSEPLELLLVTADGEPKYIRLPAKRGDVIELAHRFRRQVTSPGRVGTQTYLPIAQDLYQLLITPLEAELETQDIDTISFITDAGLRSVPLAALHDGENFLIQNYNVGLMPSMSLTDFTYQDIRNVDALVAGTSVFADQIPLPSVPLELDAISSQWNSVLLQDDTFSLNKLQDERLQSSYGIIHLATHGEFNAGNLSKSYLHLHNETLRLDQLRDIGLHKPAVELITLSACQTALGSRTAELGFAGFAVLAGAKTAVASLWNVSDEASAGLMIEFYQRLQGSQPTIKAEALRQAQLAMLQGEITIEGDQLRIRTGRLQLPSGPNKNSSQDFSHPYYWAAFSVIGSPW